MNRRELIKNLLVTPFIAALPVCADTIKAVESIRILRFSEYIHISDLWLSYNAVERMDGILKGLVTTLPMEEKFRIQWVNIADSRHNPLREIGRFMAVPVKDQEERITINMDGLVSDVEQWMSNMWEDRKPSDYEPKKHL